MLEYTLIRGDCFTILDSIKDKYIRTYKERCGFNNTRLFNDANYRFSDRSDKNE